MTMTRLSTRAATAVAATTVGIAVLTMTAAGPASASTNGSCVGQLASTAGAGMSGVVQGWQNGQPNPPGFTVPGEYASHLALSPVCPA